MVLWNVFAKIIDETNIKCHSYDGSVGFGDPKNEIIDGKLAR